jgi:hypothetical protein
MMGQVGLRFKKVLTSAVQVCYIYMCLSGDSVCFGTLGFSYSPSYIQR